MTFQHIRIAIRGGGDLGSGIAFRLARCGFPILITELPHPLLLRRAVCFGSAVVLGRIEIEGVMGQLVKTIAQAQKVQAQGFIPVMSDPDGDALARYAPTILVDARMLKKPPLDQPADSPIVIGIGPGFLAPRDCFAVIETNRGHTLGRAIYLGASREDTGLPEGVLGHEADRVLRAPSAGLIKWLVSIGDRVHKDDPLAVVDSHTLLAPFDGVLRGAIFDGLDVHSGMKVGDLDPRAEPQYSFTISDKALAVAGGVLEAILHHPLFHELVEADR